MKLSLNSRFNKLTKPLPSKCWNCGSEDIITKEIEKGCLITKKDVCKNCEKEQ